MLRRAIVVSVVLHIVVVIAVAGYLRFRTPPVQAKIHQVKFLPEPQQTPKEVVKEPPKEEPPEEEPPKEEPPPEEPEPPKEEPPPKPEPKKEQPKPKEKPPEPKKPDPPKPKKPDPPKKKEPPKEKPKEKPPEKKPDPAPAKKAPIEPGITMKEELPSVLSFWARMVKRNIEKKWKVPPGAKIHAEANTATVSFWVNRDGKLTGPPQIVTPSKDPGVNASAVRAIQQASPFPPLPDEYTEKEVQVVYTFVPLK